MSDPVTTGYYDTLAMRHEAEKQTLLDRIAYLEAGLRWMIGEVWDALDDDMARSILAGTWKREGT